MEKPPLLKGKIIWGINKAHPCWDDGHLPLLEAQRDADTLYYEPKIEQARQETAREIFEEIEKVGVIDEDKRIDLLNTYIASGVENRHILIKDVAQAQLQMILSLLRK